MREEGMKDIIQGSSVSREMEIRPRGSRIGHSQRTRAKAHVRKMLEEGYLNGKDAGARVNHIENAETSDQVLAAITDLPAMTIPSRKLSWSRKSFYVPVLLSGIFLSL